MKTTLSTQKGLTLIELLVGMAIAIFIGLLLATLYVNNKMTFRTQQAVADSQTSSRFTLDFLQSELRSAGFGGCSPSAQDASAVTSLINSGDYAYNFGQGVQGYTASGTSWTPSIISLSLPAVPAPLPGSDIITIWGTDGPGFALQTAATGTGTLDVGAAVAGTFNDGDMAIITNCSSAHLFAVTNSSGTTLSHDTTGSTPANTNADFGYNYPAGAQIYRAVSKTFYVAPSRTHSGINSLYRICRPACNNSSLPVELAMGVDKLALSYGTGPSGSVTQYQRTPATTDWNSVIAIKVSALMSTVNDNVAANQQKYTFNNSSQTTATDRRIYTPVETVVTLRNRILQ